METFRKLEQKFAVARWKIQLGAELCVIALLVLSIAACKNSVTNPNGGGGGGGNVGGNGTKITVILSEYKITMPSTITAGLIDFNVTNNGTTTHSFEIQGNSMDKRLASDLAPGQNGTLEVTLTAGTYHAFCPIDSHQSLGMTMQITVSASGGGGGGGGGYGY